MLVQPAPVPEPLTLTGVRGPLRSPFRYPGGKNWLAPVIVEWLRHAGRPSVLVEPFVGGRGVGLAVAAEDLADRVRMVELDADVAAVWTLLTCGAAEQLAERIEGLDFSAETVSAVLASTPDNPLDRPFRTIVWNRVSHGGRMTHRAGIPSAGERGRGLSSRWYPSTLAARVRSIAGYAERLDFDHVDGMDAVAAYVNDPKTVLFIDPPTAPEGAAPSGQAPTSTPAANWTTRSCSPWQLGRWHGWSSPTMTTRQSAASPPKPASTSSRSSCRQPITHGARN